MSRAKVVLAVLIPAVVVLAVGGRTWLTGVTHDAVLGTATVTADGNQAAPGAVVLALIVAAAVIAALVVGVRLRPAVLVVGALAAAAALALSVRAVLRGGDVLGPLAAAAVGRTGSLAVSATPTGWAYAAVAATALLLVGAVGAVVAARRWPAPTRRYEREGDTTGRGARGEVVHSDWQALSEGHDPTDVPPAPRT